MELLNGSTLHFAGSIIGFDELNEFELIETGAGGPFYTLQSIENPDIGFIVVSPFEHIQQYEISLSVDIVRALELESPEHALVLSIVTLKEPINESSVNLLAPLVVNRDNKMGRQVILSNTAYSVRASLFSEWTGGTDHADLES
jgi:flagellar assembly factor FliW